MRSIWKYQLIRVLLNIDLVAKEHQLQVMTKENLLWQSEHQKKTQIEAAARFVDITKLVLSPR